MPDTKFSWRALREHLHKYFWVYLIGIAVCLLGTNLLWTTTRPRASNEETVVVFMVDGYADYEPLAPIAQDMLEQTQAFDDTLKEVEFQTLMYNGEDYSGTILLMTRLAVGEGDAFLTCEAAMESLVRSQALVPLDEYVADEETGESQTFLAGLRLDSVTALSQMGAFNNQGAFLCVASNGGNVETTMKALETMMKDLTEAADAGTENTEPAA